MVDGKLLSYLDSHDPLQAAKICLQEIPKCTNDGASLRHGIKHLARENFSVSLDHQSNLSLMPKGDTIRKYTLKTLFNIIALFRILYAHSL